MRTRIGPITALFTSLAVVFIGASASAQDTRTFADLGLRLRTGDRVRVVDHEGTRHTGTVVSVSPDELVITSPEGQGAFTAVTAARVSRLGDSVLNGGVIGFLPGLLIGLQLPGSLSDQRANEGSGLKAGLIAGLIGAGIGVAIDGARKGENDLYVAAPRARVALAPFVSPHTLGAAASIRW